MNFDGLNLENDVILEPVDDATSSFDGIFHKPGVVTETIIDDEVEHLVSEAAHIEDDTDAIEGLNTADSLLPRHFDDNRDIEGGPYMRTTYDINEKRKPVDTTKYVHKYGTKAVSEMLNVTEQTIRNYCEYFAEQLEIEKTTSGRMKFTHDDVEKLRHLFRVKEENNYTMEQLRAYISNPNSVGAVPESQRIEKLVTVLREETFSAFAKFMEQYTSTTALQIEEKNKEMEQQVEKLSEIVNHQAEMFKELSGTLEYQAKTFTEQMGKMNDISAEKDLLIKQKEEKEQEYLAKIKELEDEYRAKDTDYKIMASRMEDIKKRADEQQQEIETLRAKKKKKFGLF